MTKIDFVSESDSRARRCAREEDRVSSEPADRASAECVALDELELGSQTIAGMVVRSERLRKMVKTIARLGPYRATVLIYGESGTGKDLVARALHTLGPTPDGPFISFNCANLVDSLAEAQLFGHVRGAFTDAREESLGYFRAADGGTLFLDEIGELPLHLQPKLLRVVETLEVQPVGSSLSHKLNVRIVAASNRDLPAMVKAGKFRDDLFYRLSAAGLLIPPLRQRRDAIEALVAHFIRQHNLAFGKQIRQVSRAALAALKAYEWPGNVRELAHALQTAAILTDSDTLELESLPPEILAFCAGPSTASKSSPGEIRMATAADTSLLLDDVIKRTLLLSLQQAAGNRRQAARLLGISRSTLYRMLARFGLLDEGQRPGGSQRAA